MRKWSKYALVAGLLVPQWCEAQNLVPNGSFEEYTQCPTTDGQMTFATWWSDYFFSPDFWHTCGLAGVAGVPNNVHGYQLPNTGLGYGGVHAFGASGASADGLREIMGTALSESLSVGQTYHASMYVSWTTTGPGTQGSSRYAHNNMGMLFRMQPLEGFAWIPLPNFAQVYTEEIVIDSAGWTLIEGDFVADSAYQYVFIGNFYGDFETDDTLINPGGQWALSYYYVDDICVTLPGGDCLVTSVAEVDSHSRVSVAPNPFEDQLTIRGTASGQMRVSVSDAQGRVVYAAGIQQTDGFASIELSTLPSGLYYISVTTSTGLVLHQKLVHQ